MMEIKLLIKKYFKYFLVLAGLCLAIWAYIYFVHGYTEYTYHDNGQIQTKIPYVNDKRHGIKKEYDENGRLDYEIPYVNGKKHGVEKWYYANGQISLEIPYVNGKKHGIEKEYYENGKLKSKKPYKEGRRYGYGGYYDDKGKPAMPFYPFYDPSELAFDEFVKRPFGYSYIWGENF